MNYNPAPRCNVLADYSPTGANLRRALWRKAAAMDRAQAQRVLCDPIIKPGFDAAAQARVWAGICKAMTVKREHIRLSQDCQ